MIGATLSFCHFFLNLTKLQLFPNGIILVGLRRKVTWQQGHLSTNQSQREGLACHVTAKLDFGVCAACNLCTFCDVVCRLKRTETWDCRCLVITQKVKFLTWWWWEIKSWGLSTQMLPASVKLLHCERRMFCSTKCFSFVLGLDYKY